jgi:hypothetical protein
MPLSVCIALRLKEMMRVVVPVHGFKIAFGGQRSTGFGLIYDSVAAAEKSLAKYLLYREGIQTKPQSEIAPPPTSKNTALPMPMPISILVLVLVHILTRCCWRRCLPATFPPPGRPPL